MRDLHASYHKVATIMTVNKAERILTTSKLGDAWYGKVLVKLLDRRCLAITS